MQHYPPIENPEKYASVTGTVVDQNGYAVSNATVALTPVSYWGRLPGIGELSRSVSTNADGTYTIDAIDHAGGYWVSASKPGYADEARGESSSAPIAIEPGKIAAGIDFTLSTGLTIAGRLLTEAGEPVPDGVLHILCLTSPSIANLTQCYSARTDASGYFTMGFEEKARGFVVALRAQSPQHGSATFPTVSVQDDHAIELRLSAPSVIQGTVKYMDGKPAPGATLNFFGSKRIDPAQVGSDESWASPSSAGAFMALCDTKGRYAVEVDAGLDYEASVSVQGTSVGKRDSLLALAPGEAREHNVIVDSKVATVRANIVGSISGEPFEDKIPFVVAALRDGEEITYGQPNGRSTAKIAIEGEAAQYTFQARYMFNFDLKGEISKPYDIAPGDQIEITVNLPDPQRFIVRAMDAAGHPVAGASVHFTTTTSGPLDSGFQTNEDGRVDRVLLVAPECGARVWLEKPGFAKAWGAVYEDQSAGTVHPEDIIVFSSGGGFEGDLADADGKPLANTALSIAVTSADGQTRPLQATTDAEGHFTVVDQAPAEVVDIAIRTQGAEEGTWLAEQITLEANAITALGNLALAAE